MAIVFTAEGLKNTLCYLKNLHAKKKEIIDAGKDTCDDTNLPIFTDILNDIDFTGLDSDDCYINSWGVTDNYNADCPICLKKGTDFKKVKSKDLVEITEISWDTDGEVIPYLPNELSISTSECEPTYEAEFLSNTFDFCINSLLVTRNDYNESHNPKANKEDLISFCSCK